MHTGLLYILISLSISKRHATFLRITTANAYLVLKLVPVSRLTILQPSQWGRYYYHLCFTEEKTEVCGRLRSCPSHIGWMDGARLHMQAPCFQIHISNHPCSLSSIRCPDPLSAFLLLNLLCGFPPWLKASWCDRPVLEYPIGNEEHGSWDFKSLIQSPICQLQILPKISNSYLTHTERNLWKLCPPLSSTAFVKIILIQDFNALWIISWQQTNNRV